MWPFTYLNQPSMIFSRAHRGKGWEYIVGRLKVTAEAFPSSPLNTPTIIEGADTVLHPRTGATS